tara:strand:+ start:1209 stop:1511 length:303 start_codon:yes stop_codon:yes gene_type:complete
MVKIRYTGARILFLRTAGGLVHPFKPQQVYEFDETHKRFAPFVAQLRENPSMEVLDEIGTKKVGKGVRTASKPARNKTQKKVDAALKKPKGLKKSKGKAK